MDCLNYCEPFWNFDWNSVTGNYTITNCEYYNVSVTHIFWNTK